MRQEGGQGSQLLESPMEFPEGREAGQFLAWGTAHGSRRNGITIKRVGNLGNGWHVYEKRIDGHDILQLRLFFGCKVDVLSEIVGLKYLPSKKRRDSEQQGWIVPNRGSPLKERINVIAIGDMSGNAVVDATVRTENERGIPAQCRRHHGLGKTGIQCVIRVQKGQKRGFDMLYGRYPGGGKAAMDKMENLGKGMVFNKGIGNGRRFVG